MAYELVSPVTDLHETAAMAMHDRMMSCSGFMFFVFLGFE